MTKDEFDERCNALFFQYCEVKLRKGQVLKGFILAENNNPENRKKGKFEVGMGNMRVPIIASKTLSIKQIKKGN
jgi:hypothetical protein